MSALSIQVPFPVFQDRDGQPLDNGYVWLGDENLNPQTNPIIAYFDSALTIPASQPLRTINGYVSNAGTPAQVYVDAVNFSILVQDSKGSMVYTFPNGTGISPNASGVAFTGFKGQIGSVQNLADNDGSDWIGFEQAGTGAVAMSAQDKMRQIVNIKDFGAVGDGVADDTVVWENALSAAAANAQSIIYAERSAIYKITKSLTIPENCSVDLNGSVLNFTDLIKTQAVKVSNGVTFGNGEVYVVSGTNEANATQLCPVSGGDETTPIGVKNVYIHDLKISSIRPGGNGILLYGNSENCAIRNIEYVTTPTTNRIGQVIALEWSGDEIVGTTHPHNILIENIKTGDIVDVNSVIWLSSVYNVVVRNVYAEGSFLVAAVFTGDKSNDYAVPEQKHMVGRNIILENICTNNARSYGIRVYGLPSYATNVLPQSVIISNCVLRGSGDNPNSIGIMMTACDSVKIINAEITGMNYGITFGQQCKNVTIQGGRIYNNRREGILLTPPVVEAINTTVDGVQIYGNGAAIPASKGMIVSNAKYTKVRNCVFGKPSDTQTDSLVIQNASITSHTIVENNTFLGGAVNSVAIINGYTTDYTIQTYGKNNYIATTVDYGGIVNTPLIEIDGGNKRVFRTLTGAEPTNGTWELGDTCYFGNPVQVGYLGAVCTVAGTPGTWTRFTAI